MGAELAIQLILGLLAKANEISNLLSKAKAEGRDVTAAEIDALVSADDRQKIISDAANLAARKTP